MNAMTSHGEPFWIQAWSIWQAGGWAMPVIAIVALLLFAVGGNLWFRIRSTGFHSLPEETWRYWIDHPAERSGPVGELLNFVLRGESLKETGLLFDQMRSVELARFERDLRLMRICVAAAPLLGLLGTVSGMLSTFEALASGSGGEKTMGLIAAGISEALITTETGLVIALPGLVLQHHLNRMYERYKAFLAHLETVCTQQLVVGRHFRTA